MVKQINISCSYEKSILSLKKLRYLTKICLEATPYPKWGLTIGILGNKDMRFLNRTSRGQDKPTDILSFPMNEKPAKPGQFPPDSIQHFGEIMLNEPYILDHYKSNDIEPNFYIPRILVHGLCHAQHYDHETEEDFLTMHMEERAILRHLFTTIGYELSSSDINLWRKTLNPKLKHLGDHIDWDSLLDLRYIPTAAARTKATTKKKKK
jgi:probable rRNA maturation factor